MGSTERGLGRENGGDSGQSLVEFALALPLLLLILCTFCASSTVDTVR